MTRLALRRLSLTLAWTATLTGALYGLDRFVFGVPRAGWQQVSSLDAVPPEAGPLRIPRYVPEQLRWPPREIHYRIGPPAGLWLGLASADDPAPQVWLGAGTEPLPAPLAPLAGCVVPSRERPCPEGWHSLSFPDHGEVRYLLGTLDALDMRRMLRGLQPHTHSSAP